MTENDWSKSIADYIRNNDKPIIEACDKLLGVYQEEMLPCESFSEFCDVVGKSANIVFHIKSSLKVRILYGIPHELVHYEKWYLLHQQAAKAQRSLCI